MRLLAPPDPGLVNRGTSDVPGALLAFGFVLLVMASEAALTLPDQTEEMTVVTGAEQEEAPHTLLLHRDAARGQASLGAWVRQGLSRGEKVFYSRVAGDTAVVPGLRRSGVDVELAVQGGRSTLIPARSSFPMPNKRAW